MRSIFYWAAIVVGATLAYPFVKSGGAIDQALGPWWLLTLPVLVGLLVFSSHVRFSSTGARR